MTVLRRILIEFHSRYKPSAQAALSEIGRAPVPGPKVVADPFPARPLRPIFRTLLARAAMAINGHRN